MPLRGSERGPAGRAASPGTDRQERQESERLLAGCARREERRWALGAGRWALGAGRWALGAYEAFTGARRCQVFSHRILAASTQPTSPETVVQVQSPPTVRAGPKYTRRA